METPSWAPVQLRVARDVSLFDAPEMLVIIFSRFPLPWHLSDAEMAELAGGDTSSSACPCLSKCHACSQLLSWCLLPQLLPCPEQPQLPRAGMRLGRARPGPPCGTPTQGCPSPAAHPEPRAASSSHRSLIHLISYRYTTGKIFLARSVLRQLKPNSSFWGISIHYQSCTKCSILSFFLLQVVWANNLQYFPEHREDGVI